MRSPMRMAPGVSNPHALLFPASEPPPHRLRRDILARQVLPAAAGGEHVDDALDGTTIVSRGRPVWAGERKTGRVNTPTAKAGGLHLARAG
jgi:hypothetical protein